ncbi:hypothetical protein A3K80_02280 [Candidatus Bathyarchaeota archaeon RBG_13_38_9]|nr:MAG: hypothetical protein A3K80_02280 [Candidatus Bathyarchaeota archaeon RBG_13_38_9]
MDLKVRHPQALKFSSGPTQSGIEPEARIIGGEMVPVDKLSMFLSSSWILILLILILPVAFILYRKRDVTLKMLRPQVSRLFELTQRL